MDVLVTGAAGRIGSTVVRGLAAAGHTVVGADLVDAPRGFAGPWHTVDCGDPAAVLRAMRAQRVDAVVHLAGDPGERSLPVSLASHVGTTAAVLDAMVACGVTRIVYASSNHAVGRVPRSDLLTVDELPRPDTYYGVAKVAAEALLRLFADRHGIDAVACRIGSFSPDPEDVRALSTWLSPDDAVRMVLAALTAAAPGYAVLYGISANTRAWWDLEPGRALGYEPRDDAEAFAEAVVPRPGDAADAEFVGGPFTGDDVVRPAATAEH